MHVVRTPSLIHVDDVSLFLSGFNVDKGKSMSITQRTEQHNGEKVRMMMMIMVMLLLL